MFFSAAQLFILRDEAEKNHHMIVGDAYVDDLRNSEASDLKDPEKYGCTFTFG